MKIRAKDGQTIDLAGLRVLHERNCATCAMSFCMEKLLLDALQAALSVPESAPTMTRAAMSVAYHRDGWNAHEKAVREAAGVIEESA